MGGHRVDRLIRGGGEGASPVAEFPLQMPGLDDIGEAVRDAFDPRKTFAVRL